MTADPPQAALQAHRALVHALARRATWPEPLPPRARVSVIETPISTLLLAGAHVLKLKKPVALPFVDFSSVERRRWFCHEELRLNRRSAPSLYLGVRPVIGPRETPRIGEAEQTPPRGEAEPWRLPGDSERLPASSGSAGSPPSNLAREAGFRASGADDGAAQAIDWAVWMRRFDQRALYDALARRGALGAVEVDALADAIARLHAAQPASPPRFGAPEALAATVGANLRELRAGARDDALPAAARARLEALAAWSAARAAELAPLLAARRARGAVVEGHGDLHLGNVVWLNGDACLFDALEFDPALRHTDRIAELAFPFMDLLDHRLPALAWRLASRVLDASGDHDALPALRWLAAHRALVRAKVALLGARQGRAPAANRAAARRRIALAHAIAFPPRAAPLVLTSGLSGSGKSTVALMLAGQLGALRVRSDVERKRLHALAPTARPGAAGADAAQLYGAEATRRTYARLLGIAREALAGSVGVVIDAAYLRRAERLQAQALARELGAPFAIVECRAPQPVLAARITRRQAAGGDPSDADLAVLAQQQRWHEPAGTDEPVHGLDTDGTLAEVGQRVAAWASVWSRGLPRAPGAPGAPGAPAPRRAGRDA
ncbi:MAG: AAA family ATPase [Burkholderiales bacterium]|nr:AAA family ATPase [Burkholderiales bacterium]